MSWTMAMTNVLSAEKLAKTDAETHGSIEHHVIATNSLMPTVFGQQATQSGIS